MPIPEGHKNNLDTLIRACKCDELGLVECTDKLTGKPVIVVAAINRPATEWQIVPLAKMFDGNPYDEINPPPGGKNV